MVRVVKLCRPGPGAPTRELDRYWDNLVDRMDQFVDKHPPYGPRTCTAPGCPSGSWDPEPVQGELGL